MTGTEFFRDVAIVFGPLIGVANHQLDRHAGGPAFKNAGQYFDLIGLLPLRRELVLSRPASVQPMLQHRRFQRHVRRTAVHRRPKRHPVAFPPRGQPLNKRPNELVDIRIVSCFRAHMRRTIDDCQDTFRYWSCEPGREAPILPPPRGALWAEMRVLQNPLNLNRTIPAEGR